MKKQDKNNKIKGDKDGGTSLSPVLVNGQEVLSIVKLQTTNVWKRT
jgi:hypothetical protein